jgi:uncharacterized protein
LAEHDPSILAKPAAIFGLLLAFGLVGAAWMLGTQARDFKRADRYLEVKGLVERTVKSDRATWPISFSESGDTLQDVMEASEKDRGLVLGFLTAQGFNPPDVTVGSVAVTDRSTAQASNGTKAPRFAVQQTITLESKDVDKVAAANAQTGDLVRTGVVIGSGQGLGVSYSYSGLNALKPEMITEAMHNARASADRFVADTGSKVGAIRQANQGVFSVGAADAGQAVGEDGNRSLADQQAQGSIMKKVRVVATVDYYLED